MDKFYCDIIDWCFTPLSAKKGNCIHGNCDGTECKKHFYMTKIYKNSLLTYNQWCSDTRPSIVESNNVDRDKNDFLKTWELNVVENVTNKKNLYIWSDNCGNGKTSWAIAIMKAYAERKFMFIDLNRDDSMILFINVPRLLMNIKNNISEHNNEISFIRNNYEKADIVVWDDIATKKSSEYEMEQLLAMIDARLNLGKTNIYTSNLSIKQLSALLGKRIGSRVSYNCDVVELNGIDKRNLIGKDGVTVCDTSTSTE